MSLRCAVVVGVLALAPLAACSSGDDEPAANADVDAGDAGEVDGGGDGAGAVDDAGDAGAGEGSAVGSGSGRPDSVRDDFPVPFPPGWEIDIQDEIGMSEASGAQLLYPNDAYDDVVAFYDDWAESQPDEYARSVVGEQVIYQLLGELYYQIAILPDHEERDTTWTILQVTGGIQTN